jgi:RNA polymerase sigma-70 factor (ECF subfamily)
VPSKDPDSTRWLAEHLLPHDARLRAWLRLRFPSVADLEDVVQEAYLRVLRAREECEIQSPKAFFFATARNLALARLRHRAIVRENPIAETDRLGILDENADIPHSVEQAEELAILTQAIQSLPARCRQVLTLRKLYGLSQKEVAARLGIAEHTVEAQSTIGLRRLAEFFERLERGRPFRRE